MKELNQRQKLKQLWCKCGLLSLCLFCFLGLASLQVTIMLEKQTRYQHAQVQLQSSEQMQMRFLEQTLHDIQNPKQENIQLSGWLEPELEKVLGQKQMVGYFKLHLWRTWASPLEREALRLKRLAELILEREQAHEQVSVLKHQTIYECIVLGASAFSGLLL